MPQASFVAGDWGTSNLRLFLCDAGGEVLERRAGPGAATSREQFPRVFDSLVSDWMSSHGPLPAILCGMVGSNFGWVEARYVRCPARPEQIASAAVCVNGRSVHIAPGLTCRNRFGAPDMLRGEETQILGLLEKMPALRQGIHLLCLPGTHTKWIVLENGGVREFVTAATGEIFALLRSHSVLVPTESSTEALDRTAFEKGLAQVDRFPRAQWLHRAFESRSRRLAGELADDAAAAFQSGLLIGSDVTGALQLFEGIADAEPVQLVGDPRLSALYSTALASHGRESLRHDGEAASLAGLIHLHRLLSRDEARHAV